MRREVLLVALGALAYPLGEALGYLIFRHANHQRKVTP